MMRSAFRAFCAALLLALPAIDVGAAEAAGLFSADDGAVPLRWATKRLPLEDAFPEGGLGGEAAGDLAPSPELRRRIARIDLGQLAAARSEVARGRPSHLRLNLFADADFEAVFERTAATASGHTLTGRLADDPLSAVVLAVNGDHIAGTVWSADGMHDIRRLGAGGAVIRQLNPAALGRCEVGEAPFAVRPDASPPPRPHGSPPARRSHAEGAASASQAENAASADDGSVIDVLVVYTANIRILHGGHRAMRAMIDRDVAMANEAYRVSGAAQRIALAGAVEVDHPWDITQNTSLSRLLHDFASKGDRYFEDVHELRDRYAADLVLLHIGDLKHWQGGAIARTAGVASVPSDPAGNETLAFSISSSAAFVHELGHSMGLNHERQYDRGNEPFPYSHGYRFQFPCRNNPDRAFCETKTVMTAVLPTLPRFSNPRQKWPDESGVPLGVPGDAPSDRADGPADAVRSLDEMRRAIANYRASATRCEYALSPESPALPAAGGEFRLRVQTAPGCAWSARSDGGFLSIAEGSGGVGSGEVVYRAPANPGWDREAALLVAAEVHLVRQEGVRPIAPVCDRSPIVSEALAAALDKPCGEIAGVDLASVGTLRVVPPRGGALKSGDFSGLSGLGWLFIHNPDLVWEEKPSLRLAPDLFGGLSRLRHLSLQGNALSALPPGLFEDLSELRSLDLGINRLVELAPGAFDGLDSLQYLHLQQNDLTTLSPGLFDGLTNLRELELSYNRLTTLPLGSFDGLSNLRVLNIGSNSLTTLPLGLFDGLSKLWILAIGGNSLTALAPSLFNGLSNLELLGISGNRLTTLPVRLFDNVSDLRVLNADDNQLTALAPNMFAGLPLKQLGLSGNRLRSLPPGLFAGLPLEQLWLSGNRLRSLPPGLFAGLMQLEGLDLFGNPGAPFALKFELVASPASDSSRGGSVAIAAEVASGVPFDVRVGVSASGGALSANSTLVGAGQIRGEWISVAPEGAGPVKVRLDAVPEVPREWQCQPVNSPGRLCYRGVRTVAGAPLVLHGLPDQILAPDDALRFHLPTAFPNFGAGTSYAVASSNPAAVEALIREGLLIVTVAGSGETTLSVTATGLDGRQETRRLTVKAEAPRAKAPIRSRWGGWRSALLKPPPSEDGDES